MTPRIKRKIKKLQTISNNLLKSKDIGDKIMGEFLKDKIDYYVDRYFRFDDEKPYTIYRKYKELKGYFHKYI